MMKLGGEGQEVGLVEIEVEKDKKVMRELKERVLDKVVH